MLILLDVFQEVVLPLLVLIGSGAWIAHRAGMAVAPLSNVVFNLFTPALVFHTLVYIEIDRQLVPRIVLVVTIGFVMSALAAYGLSAVLRHDRSTTAGTALCASVSNLGNMGLPISALAFGDAGLAVGVVAFVVGSVLSNSLGIVIASLADGRLRDALIAPLRVPALWAVVPALLFRLAGTEHLPAWIDVSSELLAGAAIPAMLVVLGLQSTLRRPRLSDVQATAGSLVVRLIAGPLIAWAATELAGLHGATQGTLIMLGGMPPAVIATIIAAQYDAEPELVSRTVLLSTVASFVTLTVLISLLR